MSGVTESHGAVLSEHENIYLLNTIISESVQNRVENDRGHGKKMTGGEYYEQLVLL